MAKHKCKICGANAESEYCFQHKPRKAIKSRMKTATEIDDNTKEILKQWMFFLKIWNKRPHKSEVSGTPIYGEPLTIYFHHILPKRDYEKAKYDEENIIILTFQEHDEVEILPYLYEEINRRREKLLEKYEYTSGHQK